MGHDPRNSADVAAALAILRQNSEVHVLRSTIWDLQRVGIELPDDIGVSTNVRKGTLAVGAFFLLEEGLILPHNVIIRCKDCLTPLQYTMPLGHSKAVHICVFCAVDRLHKRKRGTNKSKSMVPRHARNQR